MLKFAVLLLLVQSSMAKALPMRKLSESTSNREQLRSKRAFDRYDNSGIFYFGSSRFLPETIPIEKVAQLKEDFGTYFEYQKKNRNPFTNLGFVIHEASTTTTSQPTEVPITSEPSELPTEPESTPTTTEQPITPVTSTFSPSTTVKQKQEPTMLPWKEGDTERIFILTTD